MGKGAIYARVSTERQKEKHTIASELSILPEIMKQKGYIQAQEPYIDDGISGETRGKTRYDGAPRGCRARTVRCGVCN